MTRPSRPRVQRVALFVVLAGAAVVMLYLIRFATMSNSEVLQSDYMPIDTAGHLLRAGLGTHLYDDSVQAPVYAALSGADHRGDLLFNHAPLSAVLAVPFSVLNVTTGHALWSLFQLALLVAACVVVARSAPWAGAGATSRAAAVAVALAGAGTLPLLLEGQEVGEVALGFALAYACWRGDRMVLGGALLAVGAGIAKPHLALGLLAFSVGWRQRRVLCGLVAGGAAVLAASLLAVGWQGVVAFAATAVRSAALYPESLQQGITGFSATLLPQPAANVLAGIAVALALAVCVWLGARLRRDGLQRLEFALAGAAALSLAAAPHLASHDLVLLAPAVVMALGAASRAAPEPWMAARSRVIVELWVVLVIAAGLDATVRLGVKLTPIALIAIGAAAWHAVRPATEATPRDLRTSAIPTATAMGRSRT